MSDKHFPIYTTGGDWAAMLIGRYLYNPQGEWIGWIDAQGLVFSVRGEYAGWLARDFRVLRKREGGADVPRRQPPPRPPRLRLPVAVALPPMMAGLPYDTIDVFEEAAYRLDPQDMDSVEDID
jgi:hypothetical protein